MKIDCSHCGAEFDAREAPVKCPRCEKIVVVDAVPEVLEVVDFVEDDEPPSPQPRKAPTDRTHVVCPMCDEKNRKTAKECRYCGESLRPDELSGVWRCGNLAKTTDSHVWLRGVHSDYLGLLSEWPGE